MSTLARRAVLAGGLGTLVTAALELPAQAVLMPMIRNSAGSVANLSVTITTPTITLKAVAPGGVKAAYGFFASAGYDYLYKLGNGTYRSAKPGWNWLASSTQTWTVWVLRK